MKRVKAVFGPLCMFNNVHKQKYVYNQSITINSAPPELSARPKLRLYGAIQICLLSLFFTFGKTKLDRLQNTTKLAGKYYHLINKAVTEQNCIESTRSTAEKESCPLEFHLKLQQSVDQDHWETRQLNS